MRRLLSPWRVLGLLVVLALVTLGILWLSPSSDYILLPDRAHPVAPLVEVQGGHDRPGPGEIFFVDVFERRASELESLFPWIHEGATLVPAKLLVPPGVSDRQAHQADLRAMQISQRVAAAVALRQLGYRVVAKPAGVIVDAIEQQSHALGVLHPADVITAVDGVSTPTISSLRAQIDKLKPGDPVTLRVRRGDKTTTVRIRTIADPLRTGHAIVGFSPDQAADVKLPLKVRIDAGNVGGPSAGLAFTLQVMAELGRNVTHGYKVAATGQIELNGAVTAIGGVKQKTYGVREAKADVFLVPVDGGNAATAKRYAGKLRIIPVTSFKQALRALAALPPKG
ncbi:MAG TPA: PDZ domain-containing protein [Gaiellaceae bacterium]|nr:PDZ domain-containing protein [Gaiellaceae bacterium]